MAITNGVNLGLMVNADIGDVCYTELMRQWRALDALIQCTVVSATTTAQPASPTDGATYIIPPGATGASWSSNVGKIARYSAVLSAWEYYVPKNNWSVYAVDENRRYDYFLNTWSARIIASARKIISVPGTIALNPSHIGAYIRVTSATPVTITVSSLPVGAKVFIRQAGAGQVTFISDAHGKTRKLHSTMTITVNNSGYDLSGDLEIVP